MEGYVNRRAELYDAYVASREKDDVEFNVRLAKEAGNLVLDVIWRAIALFMRSQMPIQR